MIQESRLHQQNLERLKMLESQDFFSMNVKKTYLFLQTMNRRFDLGLLQTEDHALCIIDFIKKNPEVIADL
jgi:hypothetical protein